MPWLENLRLSADERPTGHALVALAVAGEDDERDLALVRRQLCWYGRERTLQRTESSYAFLNRPVLRLPNVTALSASADHRGGLIG